MRLVVHLTGWQTHFKGRYSHVLIEPAALNGLQKQSAADTLQIRAVAHERFVSKMGRLTATQLAEIAAAIAAVVEYE